MESQPQDPEFRNNPENFHPCFEHPNMSIFMEKKTFTILHPKIFAYLDE